MMVFDSAVSDAGVFQILYPFQQFRAVDVNRVDLKFIFGKTTKGLDAEGIGLDGEWRKTVNF